MVLIEGLPKSGPFALFALACSTDETLTATQFIERLHRQAERLAREQTSRRVSEEKTEDAETGVAHSVEGGGGQVNPEQPASKAKPPPTYWNGQRSKATYQSVHWEDEGELEEDSQTRERGHNTGRGRGRGQGRGYNKRNFRQNKNSHASTVKRNDDEEVGFIFKVSGIETFTHQTSWTKLSNIKAPESLTVDALAPLNHSVEALVLRNVNINAPVSLSVDATAPASHVDALSSAPARPVDANVHIYAPASPVEAPSSAPFQINVDAYETFAPARSVDAHAPGDSPVDAHSAPLLSSVDAHSAPRFSSVDANIAPEYITVDAQINTAPDRKVPDYSIEVSVEAFAPLSPSVDAICPRENAQNIIEYTVNDNKSNYGEFDWGFVNYGVPFARHQV